MVPHAAVAVFHGPHTTVPAQPSPSEGGLSRSVDAPNGQRAPRPPSTWPLTPTHGAPSNGTSADADHTDDPVHAAIDEFDLSPFEHLVKPADPPAPTQRAAPGEAPNLPESVGGTPFAGHPPTVADPADGSASSTADIPSQSHGYADGPVAARVVDHIDYAYEVDGVGPVDTVDDEALVSDDAWFAGVDAPPGVPMNRRRRTPTPALPPAPDASPASSGRELVPADLAPPSPPSGKTAAPKTKDRDPAVELAISEIAGHLTFTPRAVTAWYSLPEVRWAFRPDAEREALLSAIAEQYAGLAGFRLHLRRTTRPFPADEWARTVDRHTPAPLPDVPGAGTWADHLVAAQQHLLAVPGTPRDRRISASRSRGGRSAPRSASASRTCSAGECRRANGKRMARTVEQFDEVLGAFGMRGRRATAHELEWLLYRSVALGMAPPRLALAGRTRRLGAGRPARADRADRAVSHAVRLHGQAGEPADRRGTARRRARGRPDGAAGDPRAPRAVAALPRAAAVADGDLVAGGHPRAGRLVPQSGAPAADDPVAAARLCRARHGRAAGAGTAGPARAADRRRDDHRPAGRLVARARLAPDRGQRRHAGRSAWNGRAG